MSSLPLEIYERIIDLLAEDEDGRHIGVRECSLVCRTFLPRCRKHIFAFVFVSSAQRPSPLERFIPKSPWIADYIRKLHYNIVAEDLTNPSIHECLKRISKLQSLVLWYANAYLDWSSNDLRPVLLHLLQLPTLTRLQIGHVEKFLASDLTPCVNLKTFHINYVMTGAATNTFSEILPDRSIQLDEFVVGFQAKAVMNICAAQRPDGQPIIDFSSLSKIKLDLEGDCDAEVSHELLRHCKRLTHLDISFWYSRWTSPRWTCPSISKMLQPLMQTLTHLVMAIHFDGLALDPLAGVPSELEDMRNENIIENITIRVVSPSKGGSQGDDWCGLDEVLTRSGWIALKEVSVIITLFSGQEGDELDSFLRNLPLTQFPRLSKSKSVSFKFQITRP